MKNTNIYIIIISIFLNGCAISSSKEVDYENDSPVDVTYIFRNSTSAGLIDPNKLFNPITEKNEYRKFQAWWCLKSSVTPSDLVASLEKKCATVGGKIVGDWCEGKNGIPEFKFIVGPGDVARSGVYCTGGYQEIGAIVIEKSASVDESSWLAFAVQNDFMNKTDFDQARIRQQEQKEADIRRQQAKKAKESEYMLNHIGTRICKNSGIFLVYIGFIEGATTEKIKISINDAIYRNAPGMRPNGFQQTTIWDYPSNWYICE